MDRIIYLNNDPSGSVNYLVKVIRRQNDTIFKLSVTMIIGAAIIGAQHRTVKALKRALKENGKTQKQEETETK